MVLLQLVMGPVTPVYQIVSSVRHVAINYFFFAISTAERKYRNGNDKMHIHGTTPHLG